MRISEAASEIEFEQAASLMREFMSWTRTRFNEMPEVVAAYYDSDAWERELADLGNQYARPNGGVLLAFDGSDAVGCIALKRHSTTICEMKRLFVHEHTQRKGLGRALCASVISLGRSLNYEFMRLETGDLQTEAQALYRSLGFYEIATYNLHPSHLVQHMICMERAL
jgi:ribosomal protein S18 acetylase RimI-like enzyme